MSVHKLELSGLCQMSERVTQYVFAMGEVPMSKHTQELINKRLDGLLKTPNYQEENLLGLLTSPNHSNSGFCLRQSCNNHSR